MAMAAVSPSRRLSARRIAPCSTKAGGFEELLLEARPGGIQGIFLGLLPDSATFLLCVLFSMVGGIIPATLLSSAPVLAPAAGLTPVVIGLLMQGSNLGQVVGPVAIGSVIEALGWPSAAGLVGGAAVIAMLAALGLRGAPGRNL